jgi:hypothetical protein
MRLIPTPRERSFSAAFTLAPWLCSTVRRPSCLPSALARARPVIKGVDLFLHQQGLDTSTPSGRAMFQMLGVFAEFERAMIRERVPLTQRPRPLFRASLPKTALSAVR